MISLTVDTDWAPSSVIQDTISLFEEYGHEVTVFSTHDDGLELDSHERAIHPNFLDKNSNDEAVLADLCDTFPDAVGTRSHSLYTHGGLQALYPEYDLTYESNYMMYRESNLHPFWMGHRFVQVPIYFMDDVWMHREQTLPDSDALCATPGLKVFTFHPVHVYLNTPNLEYYETHKDNYQDPEALRRARYDGDGVRVLLRELLDAIERRDEEVRRVGTVAGDAVERSSYRGNRNDISGDGVTELHD